MKNACIIIIFFLFMRNVKLLEFFLIKCLSLMLTHTNTCVFVLFYFLFVFEGLSLLQLLVALILYSVWTLFYSVIQMSLKFCLKFSLKLHSCRFHKVLFI